MVAVGFVHYVTNMLTVKNQFDITNMTKCTYCGQNIDPACEWQQGRCPHRKAQFDLKDSSVRKFLFILITFYILIMLFIGAIYE